jgi:hypothetical protein
MRRPDFGDLEIVQCLFFKNVSCFLQEFEFPLKLLVYLTDSVGALLSFHVKMASDQEKNLGVLCD